jgi:hypothetical protein
MNIAADDLAEDNLAFDDSSAACRSATLANGPQMLANEVIN